MVGPRGNPTTAKEKDHRVIATGSLRRKAQWQRKYTKDKIVDLRGNIQTRLEKLHENDWDGAIFAAAALERLEITGKLVEPLNDFLPAPAQGALMVVCHVADEYIAQQLTLLNDRNSELSTHIEREFLKTLEGGCTAPIGALARIEEGTVHFSGGVYSLKGAKAKTIHADFPVDQAKDKGIALAQELLRNGGDELMKEFNVSNE